MKTFLTVVCCVLAAVMSLGAISALAGKVAGTQPEEPGVSYDENDHSFEKRSYVSLYVPGATAHFTALSGASGADLQAGVWKDLNGKTATLHGTRWKQDALGGLTYSMTYDQWAADKSTGSNYIDLGSLLPANDYTVEVLQVYTGLTNADGSPYVDSTNKYGVYSGDYACVELGPLKMTGFVSYSNLSTAGNGQNALRPSYVADKYWSQDNGKYWPQNRHYATRNTAVTLAMIHVRDNNAAGSIVKYNDSTLKMANGTDTTKGAIKFSLYENAGIKYSFNTATDITGVPVMYLSSYTNNFVDKNLPNTGNFYLMRNYPGTVYAIRVYPYALSKDELSRNHFADLVSFYRLNLSTYNTFFATLWNMEKMYYVFDDMTFDLGREQAQTELDKRIMEAYRISWDEYDIPLPEKLTLKVADSDPTADGYWTFNITNWVSDFEDKIPADSGNEVLVYTYVRLDDTQITPTYKNGQVSFGAAVNDNNFKSSLQYSITLGDVSSLGTVSADGKLKIQSPAAFGPCTNLQSAGIVVFVIDASGEYQMLRYESTYTITDTTQN